MLRRPAAPVVAAAVLSAGATALLALLPGLRFAYREAEVDVGFETAAALVGLLAAYLLLGRFDRRRRLDDLALFCALALFALTNLFFAAVPAVASDPWSAKVSTWAAVFGRLLGALALALAAFVPPTRLHVSRRVRVLALSLPVLAVATTAVVVSLLLPTLPTGIEPELSPEASVRPRLIGHPAILGMQLVGAALFAAAALGFARRAARERDAFVSSLAIASVFASFARVNYFLYPSLYTEWVYTGDAFRLLFYGFVLAAALREISSYWKSASELAIVDERRRIARDLHDGLAQELAFVARNLKRLEPENVYAQRASAAVKRGLQDARHAIAALSDPVDESLDATLAQVAHNVAAREGTNVVLALTPNAQAAPETRDALVRIVSEAITNAARHGHANLVRVELVEDGKRLRLRIADTGRGFDPDAVRDDASRGFGLRGIRERVRALDGDVRVTAELGRGTELEVVV